LFSASGAPLFQDVILNTESYLLTCTIILILLFFASNYFTSVYIYKNTGSIGMAMLFQIIPLININILPRVILLEPESFIISVAPLLMAYLFINAPENSMYGERTLSIRKVVLFGVLSGFLIATKYTCAPVVILVLFILEKNKQRLVYSGVTIFSFFIFILPAISKLKNMYQWVWGLIIHDGIYGKGEERVINPSQFVNNIQALFKIDFIFPSIYSIITIAFLISLVNKLIKKKDMPFFRTITGLWLSITFLILVVAKHCDFHYLIFAECCFPFALFISYKILSDSFAQFIQNYRRYEKRIVYIAFAVMSVFLIVEKVRYTPSIHKQALCINKYIEPYKTVPLLIATKVGHECERKEYALFFGTMFSGNLQGLYSGFLKTIYPDTYFCLYGSDKVIHWNESMSIPELYVKHKQILVYMKEYNDTAQANFINKFSVGTGIGGVNVKNIYKDSKTLQSIYLVNNDKL